MKKKKHYTDTHNPVPWLFDAHKRQLFFFSLVITFFFILLNSLFFVEAKLLCYCAVCSHFFLSFHLASIAQCSGCAMFTLVFQVFQSNHMQFSPVRISQALFSWQFYFKLLLNVIVLLCLFCFFVVVSSIGLLSVLCEATNLKYRIVFVLLQPFSNNALITCLHN